MDGSPTCNSQGLILGTERVQHQQWIGGRGAAGPGPGKAPQNRQQGGGGGAATATGPRRMDKC